MVNKYQVEYQVLDQDSILDDHEYDDFNVAIQNFDFNVAMDYLWTEFNALDQYIAETEPFKTIKTNSTKATADVAYCAIRLHELSVLLQPFMPETAGKMITALETAKKPENLFPRIES